MSYTMEDGDSLYARITKLDIEKEFYKDCHNVFGYKLFLEGKEFKARIAELEKENEKLKKENEKEKKLEEKVKPWEIKTDYPDDDDESQWKTYRVCLRFQEYYYFEVKAPDAYWAAQEAVNGRVEPYDSKDAGDPKVEFVDEDLD